MNGPRRHPVSGETALEATAAILGGQRAPSCTLRLPVQWAALALHGGVPWPGGASTERRARRRPWAHLRGRRPGEVRTPQVPWPRGRAWHGPAAPPPPPSLWGSHHAAPLTWPEPSKRSTPGHSQHGQAVESTVRRMDGPSRTQPSPRRNCQAGEPRWRHCHVEGPNDFRFLTPETAKMAAWSHGGMPDDFRFLGARLCPVPAHFLPQVHLPPGLELGAELVYRRQKQKDHFPRNSRPQRWGLVGAELACKSCTKVTST